MSPFRSVQPCSKVQSARSVKLLDSIFLENRAWCPPPAIRGAAPEPAWVDRAAARRNARRLAASPGRRPRCAGAAAFSSSISDRLRGSFRPARLAPACRAARDSLGSTRLTVRRAGGGRSPARAPEACAEAAPVSGAAMSFAASAGPGAQSHAPSTRNAHFAKVKSGRMAILRHMRNIDELFRVCRNSLVLDSPLAC